MSGSGELKRENSKHVEALLKRLVQASLSNADVSDILKLCPETSKVEDVRKTPLHIALMMSQNAVPPWIMQELVASYPDFVKVFDHELRVPLHIALKGSPAPLESIRVLIDSYPQAAAVKDSSLKLPLHYALEGEYASIDVIQALLRAHEQGVSAPTSSNVLPLHLASAGEMADLAVVQLLLDKYPCAAYLPDAAGKLPIHHALESKTCFEIINALLEAFPAAVEAPDHAGKLPLHIALEGPEPASFQIVNALLQADQSAAKMKDTSGRFPLRYAVSGLCASFEVVDALLKAYSKAAGEQDREYPFKFPIQHALYKGACADLSTVKALLAACPSFDDTPSVDTRRCLLQIALEDDNISSDVIQYLIEKFPASIARKDAHCMNALHIVLQGNPTNLEIVEMLLKANPGLVTERDLFGKLPTCYAHEGLEPCKAIVALLEHSREEFNAHDYEVDSHRPKPDVDTGSHPTAIKHDNHTEPTVGDKTRSSTLSDQSNIVFGKFCLGENKHEGSTSDVVLARNIETFSLNNAKVSIKFFKNQEWMERELDARKNEFDGRFVLGLERNRANKVQGLEGCAIVMKRAHTSLQDAMVHQRITLQNTDVQRDILKDLAKSLQHIHSKGIIHGNFKPSHAVLMTGGDKLERWGLIDMTCASRIGIEMVKTDVPSAYLPPEMFILKIADGQKTIKVRSPYDPEILPSEQVIANETIDIWSFGAVMYQFCTGHSLFHTDVSCLLTKADLEVVESLSHVDDLHAVKNFQRSLQDVEDSSARSLLEQILQCNAEDRLQNMEEVLRHPFFAESAKHSVTDPTFDFASKCKLTKCSGTSSLDASGSLISSGCMETVACDSRLEDSIDEMVRNSFTDEEEPIGCEVNGIAVTASQIFAPSPLDVDKTCMTNNKLVMTC